MTNHPLQANVTIFKHKLTESFMISASYTVGKKVESGIRLPGFKSHCCCKLCDRSGLFSFNTMDMRKLGTFAERGYCSFTEITEILNIYTCISSLPASTACCQAEVEHQLVWASSSCDWLIPVYTLGTLKVFVTRDVVSSVLTSFLGSFPPWD